MMALMGCPVNGSLPLACRMPPEARVSVLLSAVKRNVCPETNCRELIVWVPIVSAKGAPI